jgi:acyl carrier protein
MPEQALTAATFVLDALQSLLHLEPNSRRSLWFVSRGTLPVDAASVHLAGTVLDGLLKTAQVEHPGLALHHADLPAEPAEADWTALARLVQEDSAEITIAVRTSHLVVPRVGHLPANAEPSSLRVDEAAAYLVTGAFGGLGFRTIEWMAERGARCIFAAGRRAPDADLRERIAALNARGVEVIACVADISNADAVAALFAQIASHGRPLRGVIHAAGSVNDATLLQQTPDKLRSVFAAKVRGGYLLHRATEKIALDFFVLYGSAASLLGSAGQANHAAANSFLDALSRFRRLQGLPSVTIGWGAWAEIGAATRINPIHLVSREGFGLLSVEEGLLLLEEAMGSGHPELAAIRIDWQSARAPGQVRSTWPAFAAFRPADDLPGNDAVRGARSSLQQELEAAPAGDRLGVLKDYIRRSIAETLGSGAAPRDDDQPLTELGLDSLLALQLKNELQTATGVALPGHFFFEYTTIRSAATYIDAKLVAAPEAFRPQDETAYEELAL